jgi:hypothetical protein
MSLFENSQYRWRETYFVQFPSRNRPTLDKVRQALSTVGDRLELTGLTADKRGRFESLTILAPDDFAALDISYISGPEVLEQGAELAAELSSAGCRAGDQTPLARLREYDGRFDVLHFERVGDAEDDEDEEPDGMLDPSALLLVLEALAELTGGIAIDPQTGTVL